MGCCLLGPKRRRQHPTTPFETPSGTTDADPTEGAAQESPRQPERSGSGFVSSAGTEWFGGRLVSRDGVVRESPPRPETSSAIPAPLRATVAEDPDPPLGRIRPGDRRRRFWAVAPRTRRKTGCGLSTWRPLWRDEGYLRRRFGPRRRYPSSLPVQGRGADTPHPSRTSFSSLLRLRSRCGLPGFRPGWQPRRSRPCRRLLS